MSSRRAFTLIELMVVILIIAVVIAITIPAIGGARDAAKRNDTQQLLNRIGQAAASFEGDNRRQAGVFTAKEMGDAANALRGMSAMENLMLDLIGFVQAPTGATGANIINLGPVATNPQFAIDIDKFGIPSEATKAYFTPDPKHYVAQIGGALNTAASQISDVNLGHAKASDTDQAQLKDVVDAWGNPILVWVRDERAVQPVNGEDDFVAPTSNTPNSKPARYYLQSNACFLESKSLGRKGYDQTHATRGSYLNAQLNTPNTATTSLMGMLGSPSHYKTNTAGTPMYLPTAGRAAMVFQSAGPDGIFLSKKDRGARQFTGAMDYGVNVAPDPTSAVSATNQYTDSNGKPTNNDLLKLFDDVVVTAGN